MKSRLDKHEEIISLISELRSLSTEDTNKAADLLERMTGALKYISSPTMSFDGHGNPADFAETKGTEQGVRTALGICIRMARNALYDE